MLKAAGLKAFTKSSIPGDEFVEQRFTYFILAIQRLLAKMNEKTGFKVSRNQGFKSKKLYLI